jgi:hypothetical protein
MINDLMKRRCINKVNRVPIKPYWFCSESILECAKKSFAHLNACTRLECRSHHGPVGWRTQSTASPQTPQTKHTPDHIIRHTTNNASVGRGIAETLDGSGWLQPRDLTYRTFVGPLCEPELELITQGMLDIDHPSHGCTCGAETMFNTHKIHEKKHSLVAGDTQTDRIGAKIFRASNNQTIFSGHVENELLHAFAKRTLKEITGKNTTSQDMRDAATRINTVLQNIHI